MTNKPAPHRDDYAPYHSMDAFSEGVAARALRVFHNPYDGVPTQGLNAQAWDRGYEYAMRVDRGW